MRRHINIKYLRTPSNRKIAFREYVGDGPTVLFLCGFRSQMSSLKATTLMDWCARNNRGFICFDYSGHGESSGKFQEGSISDWLEDAETVFDQVGSEKKILVGSSMGGWIAMLLALNRKEQTMGILTIACAMDFLSDILIPHLTDDDWNALKTAGVTYIPSDYDDAPFPIGTQLLDDAGRYELLDHAIELDCPVELIHGLVDTHIPWETSLNTLKKLTGNNAKLTLIKDGNHQLSRPEDLEILMKQLADLIGRVESSACTTNP